MNKEIILVYKTDNRHSYGSRDLIGAATTQNKAVHLCQQQAKKEGFKIDQDQFFNLHNYKQTQGYSGEGEFNFEAVDLNKLL